MQQFPSSPQLSVFICVKPLWHVPPHKGGVPSQTQLDGVGDGALNVTVVLGVPVVVTVVVLLERTAASTELSLARCAVPTAPPTIAPITIMIIRIIMIIPSLRR